MADSFDNEINEIIKALTVSLVNDLKSANAEVELNQQLNELFYLVKDAQIPVEKKIRGEFQINFELSDKSAIFCTKVELYGNSSPVERLNSRDVIKFDFSDKNPSFSINFVSKIIPMLLNCELPWEFFNLQNSSLLFFRVYREEGQMELPSKEFEIDPNSPSDNNIFWGVGDGKLHSWPL